MAHLSDPQRPLTALLSNLSKTMLFLQNILARLDVSRSPVCNLSALLHTFQHNLLLLSPCMLCPREDWLHISDLVSLLQNAQQCFSRLDVVFVNSVRSEFRSMKLYLEHSGLENEVRGLRARIEVYIAALQGPLLLSAVQAMGTYEGLAHEVCEMGRKAIETWSTQLERHASKLCLDYPTLSSSSKAKAAGTSMSHDLDLDSDPDDLATQRKELVRIVENMIRNTMAIAKNRTQNTSSSTSSGSDISTIEELIDSRLSLVTPTSPLPEPQEIHTTNPSSTAFTNHRNEAMDSELGSLPSYEDEDPATASSSPEFCVEPSFEYLHIGPDSLFPSPTGIEQAEEK